MVRLFIVTFMVLGLLAAPVFAQEGTAVQPSDYGAKVELSRQMHEIWPIRTTVESALTSVSQQIEPANRLAFKAEMRKAINFNELEEESVNAMAKTFTVEELKAMTAFYGSPEGRSVSAKTLDYQKALEPVLAKMIDKALMDVRAGTAGN